MSDSVENENKSRYKIKNLIRFRLVHLIPASKNKLLRYTGIYARAGGSVQFILTF
jgi:hypothetical protein